MSSSAGWWRSSTSAASARNCANRRPTLRSAKVKPEAMPIGAKKKPDPLSPFKRALSLATRTLAENKSLNVVFGADAPGFDGKTIRLPQPGRAVSRKEIAVIRGVADSIALLISHHHTALHASLSPPSG